MKTRNCSNCFTEKPLTEFYAKRIKTRNGVRLSTQSRCKACNREVVLSYQVRRRIEQNIKLTPAQARFVNRMK
jgi:hypothetical protein